MLSKFEVIDILKKHKLDAELKGIKMGLAGSYAVGKETYESDIDIIFEGNSMRVEAMEYIKKLFPVKVDVLWMDLLEEEDYELDNLMLSLGLPINDYSVYKTVINEVIWI